MEAKSGLHLLIPPDPAPETLLVQRAVAISHEKEPDVWAKLSQCTVLEAYTDGSAPVLNPGGPAGFSAIIVGWLVFPESTGPTSSPDACVHVAGYIPARHTAAPTSNNRAEVAGIMASLVAVLQLPQEPRRVIVWSDSDYAVNCATGRYQRKKNLDLWSDFDPLMQKAQARLSDGSVEVRWLKGHAGTEWNEAADKLATQAAFNFDDGAVRRYRAAQHATGREMPHMSAATDQPEPGVARTASVGKDDPATWLTGADYILVIGTHIVGQGVANVGHGPASGRYQLWTRNGKGARAEIHHDGDRTVDEGDYLTLIAALENLLARITAKGGDPGRFTLAIYSRREVVVKQLRSEYRVHAGRLQSPHAGARDLLGRFGKAELIWKQGPAIARLLAL